MKTAFELQTQNHMTWLEHCELVKDLTAQLAAKDLEIAKLQPGYVEPTPPTVADRAKNAVLSALTDEEKAACAGEIAAMKAWLEIDTLVESEMAKAAAEVAVKESQPVEEVLPVGVKPAPIGKLAP